MIFFCTQERTAGNEGFREDDPNRDYEHTIAAGFFLRNPGLEQNIFPKSCRNIRRGVVPLLIRDLGVGGPSLRKGRGRGGYPSGQKRGYPPPPSGKFICGIFVLSQSPGFCNRLLPLPECCTGSPRVLSKKYVAGSDWLHVRNTRLSSCKYRLS